MYSLVEFIIMSTTEASERDERASQARTGGPGTTDQEKQRHAQQVNRELARHHRRKSRGFQSDQEEKSEGGRHKLARGSEQRRHRRSVKVSHAKEEKESSRLGATAMEDAFQKALDNKLQQQDEGIIDPIVKATKKAIAKHKAKKEYKNLNPQSKRKRLHTKPGDSVKQKAKVEKNRAVRRKENMKKLGTPTRAHYKKRLKAVQKSQKSYSKHVAGGGDLITSLSK